MVLYGRSFSMTRASSSLDLEAFILPCEEVLRSGISGRHEGLPRWVGNANVGYRHDGFRDLRCMSFASKGSNEILVAGLQEMMFVVDINKGEVLRQAPTEHHYTMMRKSRHICAATTDGSVDILDATTMQLVKSWKAHSSFIFDMDAQHDFIVTCGASYKQQAAQSYMLDPFVNVFDLKNMKAMSPLSFPPGAAFVRLHPRMLTTSLVVSQQGQIHVVDLLNPNTSNVRHANVLSYLTMVEIAPSGEAIAMADTDCYLHLWGSPSRVQFSGMQMPTEFADEETAPPGEWTLDTPLNAVGMPYYREVLLSAWPSNIISDVGAPPVKWDSNFLATLKATEYGLYGRNDRRSRRNQVEKTRTIDQTSTLHAPKFLSEKARESARSSAPPASAEVSVEEVANKLSNTELESLKPDTPAMYRNVEIKYSKFGVDDFDFG
jgi:PAB-dependent poly(A)-specific ribonuclease subunit 2